MKEIKMGGVLITLALAFLSFCFGYYFGGRGSDETLRIATQERAAVTESTELQERQTETSSAETTEPPVKTVNGKIDINTATAAEFDTLPGIGEVIAERIVTYREENGPFQSIEDLMLVDGIGEKRFDAIRDFITVEDKDENTGS